MSLCNSSMAARLRGQKGWWTRHFSSRKLMSQRSAVALLSCSLCWEAGDIVSPHCSYLESGFVENPIFSKVNLLLLSFPEVPFKLERMAVLYFWMPCFSLLPLLLPLSFFQLLIQDCGHSFNFSEPHAIETVPLPPQAICCSSLPASTTQGIYRLPSATCFPNAAGIFCWHSHCSGFNQYVNCSYFLIPKHWLLMCTLFVLHNHWEGFGGKWKSFQDVFIES